MTREQFLDLVRHPENAASLSSDAVSSLVNQFPYCQPLRYLYLRQLADQDSIHYPQQLKITAAYAPDRTRLFRLIHPVPAMAGAEDENNGYSSPLGISEDQSVATAAPEIITEEPSYLLPDPDDTITESPVIFESVKEEDLPDTTASVSAEEELLSPQDIVMQRLKELNLWKDENDAAPYTVSVPAYEEPVQEESAATTIEEPTEQDTDVPEIASGPTQEETTAPVTASDETVVIQIPAELPAMEIPSEPTVATTEMPEEEKPAPAPASTPAEPDPLDALIKESLVETRIRNSEYFSDQLLEDIQADPIPESPSLQVSGQPSAETESPVAFTEHKKEIHTFTDWLRINKPAVEQTSESPSAGATEVTEPSAPAINNEVEAEKVVEPEMPSVKMEEPEKTTTPVQQTPLHVEPDQRPAIKPISTGRIVYVKPGNTESVPSIAAVRLEPETPAPSATPAINHDIPAPAPTATVQPEPTLNQEHLISDANTEFIPQRRPIPDPSLVDTDPPRPKVPSRDLIDKFIREEPRITPSKSTFYSPANMAKKSVVEPEDLITETLANIYAQQGNFQKAIHFYEKLSLKFPEKSRYFAALINELKKKSNS